MTISGEIEHFILSELAEGRGVTAIGSMENLLTTGIVDSHGLMDLVNFLEDRYAVTIGVEDVRPEIFETVMGIEALVMRKRNE